MLDPTCGGGPQSKISSKSSEDLQSRSGKPPCCSQDVHYKSKIDVSTKAVLRKSSNPMQLQQLAGGSSTFSRNGSNYRPLSMDCGLLWGIMYSGLSLWATWLSRQENITGTAKARLANANSMFGGGPVRKP